MNGTKVAICLPGADARSLQRAGMAADRCGLAQLWAGDPRGAAANSDNAYVLAALAATATVSGGLRLGAFLHLDPTTQVMRVAEDLSIVDSVSKGRMEAGLVPPRSPTGPWLELASSLLDAPHHWPGLRGETYAVTPPLQQGWLPRVLVGGTDEMAATLGAGRAVWPGQSALSAKVCRRVSLLVDFELGVVAALAQDPVALVTKLRGFMDVAGAHQIIFIIPSSDDIDRECQALGSVVSPGMRCAPHEYDQLTRDGWIWFQEKRDLHHSPYRALFHD